jgi:hypothetical protein
MWGMIKDHRLLIQNDATEPRLQKAVEYFAKHEVRHLVIDPANARAVLDALREFGSPPTKLTAADFSEPGDFYHMGKPPLRVDVMMEIPGDDLNEAWNRRNAVCIGENLFRRLFPRLRSEPMALSGASRRKQILAVSQTRYPNGIPAGQRPGLVFLLIIRTESPAYPRHWRLTLSRTKRLAATGALSVTSTSRNGDCPLIVCSLR